MTGIQLFACKLHSDLVLLRMCYYQQHDIEVCGSRDLFVLVNSLKQPIRVISLIYRPHQVHLTGINMFKRRIDEFSMKSQK